VPVAVHLKDLLEPVVADEDFAGAINALNMSAAKGLQFMVMDDMDGGHIALAIPNINLITEVDD
jgi:hypothetical protein